MIPKPSQIEAYLAKPDPAWRVILIYGPDSGLVDERCQHLLNTILGDRNRDPFRYSEIDATTIAADPSRLIDEVEILSPLGQRAVLIRAHDNERAAESLAPPLKAVLSNSAPTATNPGRHDRASGDTLAIIKGGALAKSSKLRTICATATNAGVIPCYHDEGQKLRDIIRDGLADHRVRASADVISYLEQTQGANRSATRCEIEKLALYVGPGGVIDLEIAQRVTGSNASIGLDHLCRALASGNAEKTETILARLTEDGIPEILWLRAVARYFSRLHTAAGRCANGQTPEHAVADFRPPVFFKDKPVFFAALQNWSPARITAILRRILEAERDCKRNSQLAPLLAHRTLLATAVSRRSFAKN